jgi:acetyl esterase/lipase
MHIRAFLFTVAFITAGPLLAQQPEPPVQFTPELLQQLLKRFPDADANKDGTLTAEEARAYREKTLGKPVLDGKRPALPTPTYADAHYGPHERNVLDFWKAPSNKPTPVLVHIHGGGFLRGGKEEVSPGTIASCVSSGISFVSINYRFSSQAIYPAPMADGARAIQFLRSKAAEWNIDPKRIGSFGSSAGAGISMWIGFHDDLANPKSAEPIERQSSRLTCVGTIGGQSSYDPLQIREWLGGHAWEHPALKSLYGVTTNAEFEKPEVRKLAHDASVINHLGKGDAPVFMVYSEADTPLSNEGKEGAGIHHPKFGHILKEKMDALGIEAVYRHTKDGQQPPAMDAMLEWLKQHLLAPAK